jgi:hypothetical protein
MSAAFADTFAKSRPQVENGRGSPPVVVNGVVTKGFRVHGIVGVKADRGNARGAEPPAGTTASARTLWQYQEALAVLVGRSDIAAHCMWNTAVQRACELVRPSQ